MITLSSYEATTRHTPADVYARWSAPGSWATWDPEVRSASLDGTPALGARGRLRPRSGPAATFVITQLEPDAVFTNSSSLPGARLNFVHTAERTAGTTRVTVTVGLTGPLARLWRPLVGRGLADAARSSVEGLLGHLDRAEA